MEAPDDFELIVQLKERSTFVLDSLTVAISKTSPDGKQIGTGPFVVSSAAGQEVVMTAMPQYYRGQPQINRIVMKAYPAVRTAWAAMMRGEVDFLYEVGPEAAEFLEKEASVDVFSFVRSYGLGVILNSKRPFLSDVRVRRALNYAIDREAIVSQGLRGRGLAVSGSAWPQHWAYDSSTVGLSYDAGRASALLQVADIRKLKSTTGPHRPGLRFTCLLPENFALWERLGLLVQRDLAKVGVDMQLQMLSVNEFNGRIASRDFDAVLMEFVIGNSPSRPYFFWHSQSPLNVWGYNNAAMDRSLDGIRRAANDHEYEMAFRDFQLENVNNPPAIFLALGETARAVSKRFQVVAPARTDILPTIGDWRLADSPGRPSN